MPDGFAAKQDEVPTPADAGQKPPKTDGFPVVRIKEGGKDSQDRDITRVYAMRMGKYAVYQAGEVRIEYADDYQEEAIQRANVVSAVGKERAEITSLLVGWGPDQRRVYDCKVAMAIELALEAKPEEAQTMAEEAKLELILARAAAGCMQYVGYAAGWCLLLLLLLLVGRRLAGPAAAGDNLLLAGQAGLVGAAFSILLAVRSRTVALDTDRWSNASDGLLRLAIGVISGSMLPLLLSSGLVPTLALGEGPKLNWEDISWKGVLVVGFIAGFLERMVPDLLNKAAVVPVGMPSGQRS